MARTKASVGAKVASGKSSKARCSAAPPPASSGSTGSGERSARGSTGGGNPVCPRETPKWQRPITNFFINRDVGSNHQDDDGAGSSKPKSTGSVIESDEESPASEEHSKNTASEPKSTGSVIESDEETPASEEHSKNTVNKPKSRRIIESDEEDSPPYEEHKKNTVLDETIELQPLTGEDSHKLEEYYPKNGVKGKGVGKKTNKENVDSNISRKSFKRDLDGDEESVSKKVKV